MGRVNGHTSEQVIDAIRKSEGNLAEAARDLGISRSTAQRYVERYPTIKQALDDEREKFLDLCEKGLKEHVKDGSLPAIMYALSTIGHYRGYVKRQELTGADGSPLQVNAAVTVYIPDNRRLDGANGDD